MIVLEGSSLWGPIFLWRLQRSLLGVHMFHSRKLIETQPEIMYRKIDEPFLELVSTVYDR